MLSQPKSAATTRGSRWKRAFLNDWGAPSSRRGGAHAGTGTDSNIRFLPWSTEAPESRRFKAFGLVGPGAASEGEVPNKITAVPEGHLRLGGRAPSQQLPSCWGGHVQGPAQARVEGKEVQLSSPGRPCSAARRSLLSGHKGSATCSAARALCNPTSGGAWGRGRPDWTVHGLACYCEPHDVRDGRRSVSFAEGAGHD